MCAAVAPARAAGVSRVYTIAGVGTAGDGAPAALAQVDARCLAVLADGSVLKADTAFYGAGLRAGADGSPARAT